MSAGDFHQGETEILKTVGAIVGSCRAIPVWDMTKILQELAERGFVDLVVEGWTKKERSIFLNASTWTHTVRVGRYVFVAPGAIWFEVYWETNPRKRASIIFVAKDEFERVVRRLRRRCRRLVKVKVI